MPIRPLYGSEIEIVLRVFHNTLPLDRIVVTPILGAYGGSPFVTTFHPFAPVSMVYLVNVGPSFYLHGMGSQPASATLVHELVHVWQGNHGIYSGAFMFASIYHQHRLGLAAYLYTPGQPWKSYNVEQQANIVEDWFKSGEPKSGVLYPYVRDHLWKDYIWR